MTKVDNNCGTIWKNVNKLICEYFHAVKTGAEKYIKLCLGKIKPEYTASLLLVSGFAYSVSVVAIIKSGLTLLFSNKNLGTLL